MEKGQKPDLKSQREIKHDLKIFFKK